MTKFSGQFEDVEVREPDEHGVLRPVPEPSLLRRVIADIKRFTVVEWCMLAGAILALAKVLT